MRYCASDVILASAAQAVAESLDIAPTQEQIDTYSAYADTYGQNYCTMVALMDAVTSTLTSGAVVS